jgi:hypothetical protein
MKTAVFWVVAPCSLVEVYQHFRGPCCLHNHHPDLMEAARTSEMLVNFYQTTWCSNPEAIFILKDVLQGGYHC